MGAARIGRVSGLVQKSPSQVKVQGSLDRSAIMKVINRNQAQLQRCYERELLKDPKLAGKIQLRWFITAQGVVIQVKLKSSTMKNAAVERCIMNAVKRWKFPRHSGAPVQIVFPFIFAPSK